MDDPNTWNGLWWSDVPIGTFAMIALADWSNAHIAEVDGGARLQVWIAMHEQGYCRLPSGDYQILRRRKAAKEPNRRRQVLNPLTGGVLLDRQTGRKEQPADVAEIIRFSRDSSKAPDVRIIGFEGRDQVGEFPVLPAVIICPKCSREQRASDVCRRLTDGATRNLVLPLAFDEQSSTWYTVRTG